MKWNEEALLRLERVPFFVRKRVKRQIENYAKAQGKTAVDSQTMSEARQKLIGANHLPTAKGSISPQEIERISELIEKGVTAEQFNTDHVKFSLCGGAVGCPLTFYELDKLADKLSQIAKEEGLEAFLAGSHDGPILFHHQFNIALAGCPNNCSQPQIRDFAVIGQGRPYKKSDQCNQCNLCIEACKENAILLRKDGPLFNYTRCLNCGDCSRYCQHGVIGDDPVRYQVTIGGKLGRRPHLAIPLGGLIGFDDIERFFKATIDFYKTTALDGERFSDLPSRLGDEKIVRKILELANRPSASRSVG